MALSERCGVAQFSLSRIKLFSCYQRRRVAIANVVLVDEPIASRSKPSWQTMDASTTSINSPTVLWNLRSVQIAHERVEMTF
ncbi:hypothetical protein [Yoonia sp.]|uniref:hypothetical protein n=1 Tax=Yoonia sp. TaxID=2212373 RepID=UPI00391D09EF